MLIKRLLLSLSVALCFVACTTTPQVGTQAAAPAASGSAVIRYETVHHPVYGKKGMVVSQNAVASQVGQQILAQGGNAIDAAVAMGFALAVTLPRAGNLGGSGFMLVHDAKSKKTTALDFRSAAPAAAAAPGALRDQQGGLRWAEMTHGPSSNRCTGYRGGFVSSLASPLVPCRGQACCNRHWNWPKTALWSPMILPSR